MKNWKITSYEDGHPVATEKGLAHGQAVAAVRKAMYGSDPVTELRYLSDVDDVSRKLRISRRRDKIAA